MSICMQLHNIYEKKKKKRHLNQCANIILKELKNGIIPLHMTESPKLTFTSWVQDIVAEVDLWSVFLRPRISTMLISKLLFQFQNSWIFYKFIFHKAESLHKAMKIIAWCDVYYTGRSICIIYIIIALKRPVMGLQYLKAPDQWMLQILLKTTMS